MHVLATQAYSKTLREVTRIGKTEVEDKRMMYLYPEKLVTEHREFPIANVLDMSYRQVGKVGGLLYVRSEERRVGKERGCRWWRVQEREEWKRVGVVSGQS